MCVSPFIHDARQLVAYSELISPKGRRNMKKAESNNERDAVVFGVAGQHQNSNQPTSSLGKPHTPQVQQFPLRLVVRRCGLVPPHVQPEIGVIIMHLPPAHL